jgi:CheY-like chemotaxis protein
MAQILVIEDDEALRELLSLQLQRQGHAVLTAEGGHAALRMAESWIGRVDLVITDIFMPDGDGIETLIALRRIAGRLPVIAMSGGGHVVADGVHYLDIADRLGAVATLRKPFTSQDVAAAIATALGAGRSHWAV